MLNTVRNWLAMGLGALALQAFAVAAAQESEPRPMALQEPAEPCPEDTRCVIVAEPYLEMHSGPGRGYPVFHVAERGEQLQVLARRTDWFYVRTRREIEGWVPREQFLATLERTGEFVDLDEPTRNDYTTRRWEAGAFMGRFEGASLIALFAGYGLSDHLSAELTVANAIGNITDSYIGTIGLNHNFAPEWRVSPYVGLGTGIINIKPRVTLVQPVDRTDQIGYVAAGARGYIGRRFLLRFEYRGNVIFTSRDENEEIHEWKLGFAFFF